MKKISYLKYSAYIMATLFMAGIMFFVPEISDAVSNVYIVLIGAFLGIDLATMLTRTNALPEGEYKEMKKEKYMFSFVCTILLFAFGVYIKNKYKVSILGTLSILGISLMTTLTLFIGGLEANKLLTGTKKEE